MTTTEKARKEPEPKPVPATPVGQAPPAKKYEERIDPHTGERYLAVYVRGAAIKDDPILNKGTCFSREERDRLGLQGIIPPAIVSETEQEARAYGNFLKAGDDVRKYLFLAALQDRNETLFFRLLLRHMEEMAPIVYTPTVGKACQQYSHIYRRPRGLYISSQDRGRMKQVLRNSEVKDPEIIVCTDNEAILGIGDQGVGGMAIAIGKLALYTAGAGVHPSKCLPLDFDCGTNNQELLEDPLYLGVRHTRLRGDAYFTLIDELVEAIQEVFPQTLVQWEDFSKGTAFQVMDRYRRKLPSFDDDVQGTGAVIVSGILTGLKRAGRKLLDERIVFYGAGASGAGCALAVRNELEKLGVPKHELAKHVLSLDSHGLLVQGREGLDYPKDVLACDPALPAAWKLEKPGRISLLDVVRNWKPTVLVGASGQPRSFTEEMAKVMAQHCERPIFLPISNPTTLCEALPQDLITWTQGRAIVGTGSPFAPVYHNGKAFVIGQGNNVFCFPGIGLGAVIVKARWLPEEVFAAAARALHEFTLESTDSDGPIYPPLSRLREASKLVACAVGRALVASGAAPPMDAEEIERRVITGMWKPDYLPYRPA
jgi:malic enzyme